MSLPYDKIPKRQRMTALCREENRLRTFIDWPFVEQGACNPKAMAKAGFFHCPKENEPDLVACFVCNIKLDCWEPQDDPWAEHKKAEPSCMWLKLSPKERDFLKCTYGEVIETVHKCEAYYMKKVFDEQRNFMVKATEEKRDDILAKAARMV